MQRTKTSGSTLVWLGRSKACASSETVTLKSYELLEEVQAECWRTSCQMLIEVYRIVQGKGFAYVCFKQVAAAKKALELDQSMLHERPIRVTECMNENKYAAKSNKKAKLSGAKLRVVKSGRTFQGKAATPKDAAIMKRVRKPKAAPGGKKSGGGRKARS